MLVTNPAARAPLSEVLNHPWMLRGYRGPPDSHLIRREPLRSDELDKQVIRGMKGFEFGTEEEIERKLIDVLESDAYFRAVQHWERKRSMGNGRNGHGRWGESFSDSSIAIASSFANTSTSALNGNNKSTDVTASPKKSKRFSTFDFYRRKLFSPSNSPPSTPLANSPPSSQTHLSQASLPEGGQREPADPTYGFHPLISIYFLAREKMERERVYGPGHFASSQLSLESTNRADLVQSTDGPPAPPPTSTKPLSQPSVRKPDMTVTGKPDYSMPLPRLPAPETSHYSGMSYDANSNAPSPTTPGFPQPRARDAAMGVGLPKRNDLPPPTPISVSGVPRSVPGSPAKTSLPRAPPASTHRRSHSLSQRPSATRGWTGMFGGHSTGPVVGEAVDEYGTIRAKEMEPPRTAGPELSAFAEKMDASPSAPPSTTITGAAEEYKGAGPLSAGASLVRKFGSLLGGAGGGVKGDSGGKYGSVRRRSGISPRPSGDTAAVAAAPVRLDEKGGVNYAEVEVKKESVGDVSGVGEMGEKVEGVNGVQGDETVTPASASASAGGAGKTSTNASGNVTPTQTISSSQSQPIGTSHRRAATILDPQGRSTRHERRSSTGAALFSSVGGTIGRHRRPSTGFGSSQIRPTDRFFGRTDEVDENAAEEEVIPDSASVPIGGVNAGVGSGRAMGVEREGEQQGDEKEYKSVYLKGLFRYVVNFSSLFLFLFFCGCVTMMMMSGKLIFFWFCLC